MRKYCVADVELFVKTVLKFREMFVEKLDVDPFRYVTLASLCMSIYVNKFMPEKTIVGNDLKGSVVCKEWLHFLNDLKLVPEVPIAIHPKKLKVQDINKGKVGPTKTYYDKERHCFTVDALNKQDKTVFEFQGCYFHGCRTCKPENVIKHDKTVERIQLLEAAGYKVVQMWECEWKAMKKTLPNWKEIEETAKGQHINIRDALFGGRTEAFKTYLKCERGQKIYYFDVVSLYPTVNALDVYPVGF
jgi:hypothetical protein